MAKTSKRVLDARLREPYMEKIRDLLEELGEEVLRTAANELTIPCIDEEDNEKYLTLVFKVPSGSKGEEYNGYDVAEDYKFKLEQDAIKAEKKLKGRK